MTSYRVSFGRPPLFQRVARARIFDQAQFHALANPKRGHWLRDLLAESR